MLNKIMFLVIVIVIDISYICKIDMIKTIFFDYLGFNYSVYPGLASVDSLHFYSTVSHKIEDFIDR